PKKSPTIAGKSVEIAPYEYPKTSASPKSRGRPRPARRKPRKPTAWSAIATPTAGLRPIRSETAPMTRRPATAPMPTVETAQAPGQRRQREGADARAARGEADGETAPCDEPLHDRRVARHVRRAHAERSHEAVENVRLPQLGDERHASERHAQEKPAGGDHDPRAPEVGEPPGGEAEDAVGEGVDGKRAREARAAPAELPEERVEEDAEGVLGAVGDEED